MMGNSLNDIDKSIDISWTGVSGSEASGPTGFWPWHDSVLLDQELLKQLFDIPFQFKVLDNRLPPILAKSAALVRSI